MFGGVKLENKREPKEGSLGLWRAVMLAPSSYCGQISVGGTIGKEKGMVGFTGEKEGKEER